MPSACFDAIRNVSTTWKHAKGMSLRYGVNLSAVMVYKMAASQSLKGCDAVFCFFAVLSVLAMVAISFLKWPLVLPWWLLFLLSLSLGRLFSWRFCALVGAYAALARCAMAGRVSANPSVPRCKGRRAG